LALLEPDPTSVSCIAEMRRRAKSEFWRFRSPAGGAPSISRSRALESAIRRRNPGRAGIQDAPDGRSSHRWSTFLPCWDSAVAFMVG
jgi:hypothetical protein